MDDELRPRPEHLAAAQEVIAVLTAWAQEEGELSDDFLDVLAGLVDRDGGMTAVGGLLSVLALALRWLEHETGDPPDQLLRRIALSIALEKERPRDSKD